MGNSGLPPPGCVSTTTTFSTPVGIPAPLCRRASSLSHRSSGSSNCSTSTETDNIGLYASSGGYAQLFQLPTFTGDPHVSLPTVSVVTTAMSHTSGYFDAKHPCYANSIMGWSTEATGLNIDCGQTFRSVESAVESSSPVTRVAKSSVVTPNSPKRSSSLKYTGSFHENIHTSSPSSNHPSKSRHALTKKSKGGDTVRMTHNSPLPIMCNSESSSIPQMQTSMYPSVDDKCHQSNKMTKKTTVSCAQIQLSSTGETFLRPLMQLRPSFSTSSQHCSSVLPRANCCKQSVSRPMALGISGGRNSEPRSFPHDLRAAHLSPPVIHTSSQNNTSKGCPRLLSHSPTKSDEKAPRDLISMRLMTQPIKEMIRHKSHRSSGLTDPLFHRVSTSKPLDSKTQTSLVMVSHPEPEGSIPQLDTGFTYLPINQDSSRGSHKQACINDINSISLNNVDLINTSKAPVLCASNSTSHSLSVADIKTFNDTGISSSPCSVITPPSESPLSYCMLTNRGVKADSSICLQEYTTGSGRLLQSHPCTYSNTQCSTGRKYPKAIQSSNRTTNSTTSFISRAWSGESGSKLLPPSNVTHTLTSSVDKNASRQRAQELYSIVRRREETRPTGQNNHAIKTPFSKASSMPAEPKPIQATQTSIRPQALSRQTSNCMLAPELNIVTSRRPENTCNNQAFRSTTSTDVVCHDSELKLSKPKHQSQKFTSSTFTKDRETTHLECHGDSGKHEILFPMVAPQSVGPAEWQKRYNVGEDYLHNQAVCSSRTVLGSSNMPENQYSTASRPVELNNPMGKSMDHGASPITTKTDISHDTLQPYHNAIASSMPCAELSDGAEQLLNSLSNICLESANTTSLWDESCCLSDVESEYAALGLLLPFAASLHRSCVNLTEVTKSECLPYSHTRDLDYNCENEVNFDLSKMSRPSTAMGSLIGRFRDNSLFSNASNSIKLPVASVAPMMVNSQPLRASSTSLGPTVATSQHDPGLFFKRGVPDGTVSYNESNCQANVNLSKASTGNQQCVWMEDDGTHGSDLSQYNFNPLDHVKLPYLVLPPLTAHETVHAVRSSLSNHTIPGRTSLVAVSMLTNASPQTNTSCSLESDSGDGYIPDHQNQENEAKSTLPCEQREIERLQTELRLSHEKISALTSQIRVQDTQIDLLRHAVSQLYKDMNRLKVTQDSTTTKQRPPRSTSCRALPENFHQQDVQETISLTSLTSGISSGSQELYPATPQSLVDPHPTGETASRQTKRSRWIHPAIGKAFKKRSKSNMDCGDRDGVRPDSLRTGSTATVFTHAEGSRSTLAHKDTGCLASPEALKSLVQKTGEGNLNDFLQKMRWKIGCLEEDNRRLRQMILSSTSLDENIANPRSTVGLTDLTKRHCTDACHTVCVVVKWDSATCDIKPLPDFSPQIQSGEPTLVDSRHSCPSGKLLQIGRIGLSTGLSWAKFDLEIIALLDDYIKFLDPDEYLGLQSITVEAYHLALCSNIQQPSTYTNKILRRFRDPTINQSTFTSDHNEPSFEGPHGWLEGVIPTATESSLTVYAFLTLCELCGMKDVADKQTAQQTEYDKLGLLSFETLVPTSILSAYLTAIRNNRFTVLCGPTETGKTKILRRLGAYLMDDPLQKEKIMRMSIKPNTSTTIDDVLTFIRNATAVYGAPVVILEGLHNMLGSTYDLVTALTLTSIGISPIILATSDISNKELDKLQQSGLILLLEHLTDLDSTTHFLSCYLRRKLAQTRVVDEHKLTNRFVTENEDLRILTHLISWLPKVWKRLNRLLTTDETWKCSTIFGLRVFLTCPMDVIASQNWFTDLWNNLFMPFLFRKHSADKRRIATNATTWTSYDWITATWPWPSTSAKTLLQVHHVVNTLTDSASSDKDCSHPETPRTPLLLTFGVSNRMKPIPKPRSFENRSSLDSGIVPDGFPTSCSATNSGGYFENRSSLGSDSCDRLSGNITLSDIK